MTRRSFLAGLSLLALGLAGGVAGTLLGQRILEKERSLVATVFMPLQDNAGRSFSEKERRAALHIFVADFGGATLGDKRVGFWLGDKGKVHEEPIQLLTVSFERDRLNDFREAVKKVGRLLRQDSMYLRWQELGVELVDCGSRREEKDR